MSEAVYVRFEEHVSKFLKSIALEENITRSEVIQKLVNNSIQKLKLEKALNNYKQGKCTIRECAELAELRYFEFFDVLAKENLIGTSSENTELLLSEIKKLK